MSYRFNSFYTDTMHSFVQAMNVIFQGNTAKSSRPAFVQSLMFKTNTQTARARQVLQETGKNIIDERRTTPVDKNDVLNSMIFGKDPKTGLTMRDELIVAQMTTFLIAGHETTSGLLSFAIMQLLLNPDAYLNAQKEVDTILGSRPIEADDIHKLRYLNAVLGETSRLSPTVPLLQKHSNPLNSGGFATLDGGKYQIQPDDNILILIGKAQQDPNVWGDNAEDFDPDRMMDENFDKVTAQYPGAWKPFGNGKRACIGRAFAWQESMLVLAMMFQNFEGRLDNPHYKPIVKQALTIKPGDLYIRVTSRKGMDATVLDKAIHGDGTQKPRSVSCSRTSAVSNGTKPLTVLYGSNTGTCQAFAQRLAVEANARGFSVDIRDLDSATNALPSGQPVIIITSSYEGQPPDNAARFVEWLSSLDARTLSQLQYTVFGCGHPKLLLGSVVHADK